MSCTNKRGNIVCETRSHQGNKENENDSRHFLSDPWIHKILSTVLSDGEKLGVQISR